MSHHAFSSFLFRFTVVLAVATGSTHVQADLLGPRGSRIEPEQDFVDVGHFGFLFPGELDDDPTLTGARNVRGLDDGSGQWEALIEVGSPVSFVEPGMGGGPLGGDLDDDNEPFEFFVFTEIPFAEPIDTDGSIAPSIPEVLEGTSLKVTTTLPLVDSDPFNVWTVDLFECCVYYPVDDIETEENPAFLLEEGVEVTFDGVPVTNFGSQLANNDESLVLFFDPVSGSGEFEVTFFLESAIDIPVAVEGGTPGGFSFNALLQNAATGDTTPGLWNADAAGFWTDRGNWGIGGLPTTAVSATFGDVLTAARTVVVDDDVAAGGIEFDSPNRYVLAGPGTLSLQSDSGSSTVTVTQGSHEFQSQVALVNNTTIAASATTQLDFDNSLDLGGNTLTITGAGQVNINNSAEVVGGTGDVSNQGNLGGSGRIAGNLDNEMGGILGPGSSAGNQGLIANFALLVDGDFTQDNMSTLAIELGGLLAGEFDLLDIAGTATLDGDLQISLIDSFLPSVNDTFDILTASSITDSGLTLSGESGFVSSIVAGGNGQVLRLEFTGAVVPEPGSFMLVLFAMGASLGFRRRITPIKRTSAKTARRRIWRSSTLTTAVALMSLIFCSRYVMAQPTLVTFDLGVNPDSSFDVMGDQIGISVAGLSTSSGALNVINFPPAEGEDLFQFTPSIDGEEDFIFDHTGGQGAIGDFTYIISEVGPTGMLFEDPDAPTFGVLDQLKVSSVWIGRTFYAATDGEIVGLYEGVEKWRVPVVAGVIDFDEVGVEVAYVEVFTPQGANDFVNELQFEGSIPIFDDMTIGLTDLPAPPSTAAWIGGSFGLLSGAASWSTLDAPSDSLGAVVDSVDSSRLLVTDGGFTSKSLTIDGGESSFLGAGAITLDSNTNDPTLELLSGNADFQAPVVLADPLVIDVATGSTLVFDNVVDLGGNMLTITGGGTVTFNNLVLGGGTIVYSGDYDDDGLVGAGDLSLVLANWGEDASQTGVPDGWINMQPSGLIGAEQLSGVLQNWGNTASVPAVPEPVSPFACWWLLLGILACRRHTV